MEFIERQIENTPPSVNTNGNKFKKSDVSRKIRKKRSLSESSSGSVQIFIKDFDECTIEETFTLYINETLNRLNESEKLTSIEVIQIKKSLFEHKLTGQEVSLELEKELIRICQIEYDQIELNSDRLCGFGWSKTRITTHIKKCMQDKLDEAIEIIQAFL